MSIEFYSETNLLAFLKSPKTSYSSVKCENGLKFAFFASCSSIIQGTVLVNERKGMICTLKAIIDDSLSFSV